MADIETLIKDLKSGDLEIRYNACKELENELHLTDEAINALRVASYDPDPLIAVAANKLLRNQKSKPSSKLNSSRPQDSEQVITKRASPLLTIENIGLIMLSALTAFLLCFGGPAVFCVNMSGADTENYIGLFIIICVIGGAVSTFAAVMNIVYLHFWRGRFRGYVDVLLSIGFGILSVLIGAIIGYIIDFILVFADF